MSGCTTVEIINGEIARTSSDGSSVSATEKQGFEYKDLGVNSVLNLIISRASIQENIHIKNPEKVEGLINDIISSGPRVLQVITDFDATLSRYEKDEKKLTTSYGVICGSKHIPDEVKARGAALYAKYYPYESDTTISAEERKAKMAEWYELKHENYLDSGVKITASEIAELVQKGDLILRDGAHELLRKLDAADIPTLVFSAGNGNSIEALLKLDGVNYPNIRIFSNFIEFDETTKEFKGFRKPTIHPANKNQAIALECDPKHFDNVKERKAVILLGDNIADPEMATGLPEDSVILKIGFLNYNIERQLEAFKQTFDIVLVDDPTMHLVNALLDLVLKDTPEHKN